MKLRFVNNAIEREAIYFAILVLIVNFRYYLLKNFWLYIGCGYTGFYGTYCNITCPINCRDNTCHSGNGNCDNCKTGRYGSRCDNYCPNHCNGNTCHKGDGTCSTCEPGFYGSKCGVTCPTNCKYNVCHMGDGTCSSCDPGFYGSQCKISCPTNCKDNICDQEHGTCASCKPGFYKIHCDTPCPTNCKDNSCHFDYGTCYECKPGWTGTTCQRSQCNYFAIVKMSFWMWTLLTCFIYVWYRQNVERAGSVRNVITNVQDIVGTTLSVTTWPVTVNEAALLDGQDTCVRKVAYLSAWS